MQTTSNPIRRARVLQRYTQAQIAEIAGINEATVVRAEKGLSLSPLTQARLAHALGVDIDTLFPIPEPEPEEAAS